MLKTNVALTASFCHGIFKIIRIFFAHGTDTNYDVSKLEGTEFKLKNDINLEIDQMLSFCNKFIKVP